MSLLSFIAKVYSLYIISMFIGVGSASWVALVDILMVGCFIIEKPWVCGCTEVVGLFTYSELRSVMNLCLWIPLFHTYRLDTEVTWQVDMDSMSHIFSSFIGFLQLEDAYNIIVLNPRRNATRANYGYRSACLYVLFR